MEIRFIIYRLAYGQKYQKLSVFHRKYKDKGLKLKSIIYKALRSPFCLNIIRSLDMPAHVRSALTQTSLSIPILQSKVALGQWQGIFLFEHRHMPATRRIILHAIGD